MIGLALGGQSSGYVYFLQCETTGPIKIGTAGDVRERVARLRTMSPYPLRLLCVTRGDRKLESSLHQRFHRWRLHGEWFEPNPSLFEFIHFLNKSGSVVHV